MKQTAGRKIITIINANFQSPLSSSSSKRIPIEFVDSSSQCPATISLDRRIVVICQMSDDLSSFLSPSPFLSLSLYRDASSRIGPALTFRYVPHDACHRHVFISRYISSGARERASCAAVVVRAPNESGRSRASE